MQVLTVLGNLFIPRPWLALIPDLVFAGLCWLSRRHLAGAAAVAWVLHAAWEYSIYSHWLCSGDCNIRVDLLLAYPALVLLSLAGRSCFCSTSLWQGGGSEQGRSVDLRHPSNVFCRH